MISTQLRLQDRLFDLLYDRVKKDNGIKQTPFFLPEIAEHIVEWVYPLNEADQKCRKEIHKEHKLFEHRKALAATYSRDNNLIFYSIGLDFIFL